MTSAAVLIPARTPGDDWRASAREYVAAWWARHFAHVPVHLGDCDGPWSKGAAVAAAYRAAGRPELVIVADADSFLLDPIHVRDAIGAVLCGAPWAIPHRKVYRLRDTETARLEADPDVSPRLGWTCRPVYEGPPGGGITVVSRDAYETVGGIDRRFLGWGGEDLAFGWALETLAGSPARFDGRLVHLWHPHPAPDLRGPPESEALVAAYKSARGVRRRMAAVTVGEPWDPAPPLERPVRFRMTANRQSLRLPSGDSIRFTRGTYETVDPDEVEQLRRFAIVREEIRR